MYFKYRVVLRFRTTEWNYLRYTMEAPANIYANYSRRIYLMNSLNLGVF